MHISAIYNPLSSKETVALVTEPALLEQVFNFFVELCNDSNEMRRYHFEYQGKDGMLLMRWAEEGKTISVSEEVCDEIRGKLELAMDKAFRIQEQAQQEREERSAALEKVAKAFGVSLVDEIGRRLDSDL